MIERFAETVAEVERNVKAALTGPGAAARGKQ